MWTLIISWVEKLTNDTAEITEAMIMRWISWYFECGSGSLTDGY